MQKRKGEMKTELRRWRKMRGEGVKYKRRKAEYNRLFEGKQKEEKERWERKAAEVRRERHVWDIVNRERKRRKEVNEEIKEEQWRNYFIRLLGGGR